MQVGYVSTCVHSVCTQGSASKHASGWSLFNPGRWAIYTSVCVVVSTHTARNKVEVHHLWGCLNILVLM
jgi:hypothetical protein